MSLVTATHIYSDSHDSCKEVAESFFGNNDFYGEFNEFWDSSVTINVEQLPSGKFIVYVVEE